MKRKPIPQKVRRRVYEKYGGRCAYCGQPIAYRDMQVEHLVPLAKGGADREENYMPSCHTCNHYKHTLMVEQFRQEIGKAPNRLMRYDTAYRLAVRFGLLELNRKPVTFYFERKESGADGL